VSTQRGGTQGAAAAMRAALDAVGVGAAEGPRWKAHIRLEKRWGDNPDATPYEVIERDDNLLMYGGASALWQQLIGSGAITAYSDANFAWQEWAVFNASSTGRMLNRKVESLGTKTSSAAWTLTVTITLS
jgi:hypothetical protein